MKRIWPIIIGLIFLPLAIAGEPPLFVTDDGAIRGYDPVAYFIEGKPTRGRDEFSAAWMGATFKFANAENLARFQADPTAFAPQYGGYCAYAVSQGYTASIDPDAWSIVDGRLYLNYSKGVQKRWQKDVPGHIAAANRNWPDVLD